MLARPSCICNSVRLIQCAGGSGYCVCHRLADLSWGRDVSAACRCAVECAVGRAAVSVPELTKRQSPGRRGDPSTGWGAAGGSGRGLAPSQRRCREGGERLLSASPFAASTSSERLSGLGGKGGGVPLPVSLRPRCLGDLGTPREAGDAEGNSPKAWPVAWVSQFPCLEFTFPLVSQEQSQGN